MSTAVATSQKAVVIASTSVSTTGSPPAASRSHPPVTVPPAALSAAARGSPAATGPSSRPAAQVDFASHTPIVATSTSFKQTDAGRLVQRLNDALRVSSSRHVAESPYASSVQAGDCSHPRPGSPTVAIEMDPLPPRRLPFVASEADLSVRQKAVDAASGPKRTATMALYQPRTAEPASDDPAATTVSWTYGRQSPTRGLTANGHEVASVLRSVFRAQPRVITTGFDRLDIAVLQVVDRLPSAMPLGDKLNLIGQWIDEKQVDLAPERLVSALRKLLDAASNIEETSIHPFLGHMPSVAGQAKLVAATATSALCVHQLLLLLSRLEPLTGPLALEAFGTLIRAVYRQAPAIVAPGALDDRVALHTMSSPLFQSSSATATTALSPLSTTKKTASSDIVVVPPRLIDAALSSWEGDVAAQPVVVSSPEVGATTSSARNTTALDEALRPFSCRMIAQDWRDATRKLAAVEHFVKQQESMKARQANAFHRLAEGRRREHAMVALRAWHKVVVDKKLEVKHQRELKLLNAKIAELQESNVKLTQALTQSKAETATVEAALLKANADADDVAKSYMIELHEASKQFDASQLMVDSLKARLSSAMDAWRRDKAMYEAAITEMAIGIRGFTKSMRCSSVLATDVSTFQDDAKVPAAFWFAGGGGAATTKTISNDDTQLAKLSGSRTTSHPAVIAGPHVATSGVVSRVAISSPGPPGSATSDDSPVAGSLTSPLTAALWFQGTLSNDEATAASSCVLEGNPTSGSSLSLSFNVSASAVRQGAPGSKAAAGVVVGADKTIAPVSSSTSSHQHGGTASATGVQSGTAQVTRQAASPPCVSLTGTPEVTATMQPLWTWVNRVLEVVGAQQQCPRITLPISSVPPPLGTSGLDAFLIATHAFFPSTMDAVWYHRTLQSTSPVVKSNAIVSWCQAVNFPLPASVSDQAWCSADKKESVAVLQAAFGQLWILHMYPALRPVALRDLVTSLQSQKSKAAPASFAASTTTAPNSTGSPRRAANDPGLPWFEAVMGHRFLDPSSVQSLLASPRHAAAGSSGNDHAELRCDFDDSDNPAMIGLLSASPLATPGGLKRVVAGMCSELALLQSDALQSLCRLYTVSHATLGSLHSSALSGKNKAAQGGGTGAVVPPPEEKTDMPLFTLPAAWALEVGYHQDDVDVLQRTIEKRYSMLRRVFLYYSDQGDIGADSVAAHTMTLDGLHRLVSWCGVQAAGAGGSVPLGASATLASGPPHAAPVAGGTTAGGTTPIPVSMTLQQHLQSTSTLHALLNEYSVSGLFSLGSSSSAAAPTAASISGPQLLLDPRRFLLALAILALARSGRPPPGSISASTAASRTAASAHHRGGHATSSAAGPDEENSLAIAFMSLIDGPISAWAEYCDVALPLAPPREDENIAALVLEHRNDMFKIFRCFAQDVSGGGGASGAATGGVPRLTFPAFVGLLKETQLLSSSGALVVAPEPAASVGGAIPTATGSNHHHQNNNNINIGVATLDDYSAQRIFQRYRMPVAAQSGSGGVSIGIVDKAAGSNVESESGALPVGGLSFEGFANAMLCTALVKWCDPFVRPAVKVRRLLLRHLLPAFQRKLHLIYNSATPTAAAPPSGATSGGGS